MGELLPVSQSYQRDAVATNALGEISLVTERWTQAVDTLGVAPVHHLQLSLVPLSKTAAGRFVDRWGPQRFSRFGQLFWFPAHEAIQARSDQRVQRSVVCHLKPDAMTKWLDLDCEWTDRRMEASLDITNQTLHRLMYKLREELLHPGFGSDTMLELIVAQLGLELSRHILGIGEEFVTGGLAPWRLRLIDEMLENDPANATSLKMAGLCNLSLRQLARAFRQSRGYSLGTFIATRRLDKAKHLLASGSAVKQAAHAAGFTSSSSFSFAFRKMTGETPREFKQGLKRRD